jgi:hypothetical protein
LNLSLESLKNSKKLIQEQKNLKEKMANLQENEDIHFQNMDNKFNKIEASSSGIFNKIGEMFKNQNDYAETHSKFQEENKKEFGFDCSF